MKKIKKVLIANRGEIAVRIIMALKELGIYTVAAYSEADRNALFTKYADESICIGPAEVSHSYLDAYKILSAAEIKNVDSIHPGIGFFAEDGDFCELCNEYGFNFIGPNSKILHQMGNKCNAKLVAKQCGVPVVSGSQNIIKSIDDCKKEIKAIGLPIIMKATSGGGGKGIRIVDTEDSIEYFYNLCKAEALSSFSNGDILVEQYIQNSRHVEVQIIGDKYGNVIHLGDRECTLQRSNQKIIEECLCANISEEVRCKIYNDAIKIAKSISYVGVGTVEFLILPDNKYYFVEMNTRLQVEHTITELLTGIDIVKEQIKMFNGEKLSYTQEDIKFNGYAFQCRILAENVEDYFSPSFGVIQNYTLPCGQDVRIDNGYQNGDRITPYYDSLLCKISCRANDKISAIKKMRICLENTYISGVRTNIEFLKFLICDKDFVDGNYNEVFVENIIKKFQQERREYGNESK